MQRAIEATRDFFEQMGIPTRLSGYGLDGKKIPAVVEKLREHSMTELGEHHRSPRISAAGFWKTPSDSMYRSVTTSRAAAVVTGLAHRKCRVDGIIPTPVFTLKS